MLKQTLKWNTSCNCRWSAYLKNWGRSILTKTWISWLRWPTMPACRNSERAGPFTGYRLHVWWLAPGTSWRNMLQLNRRRDWLEIRLRMTWLPVPRSALSRRSTSALRTVAAWACGSVYGEELAPEPSTSITRLRTALPTLGLILKIVKEQSYFSLERHAKK